MGKKRIDSDEYYVLDICDEVLGETGKRQHKFSFLVGDTGRPLAVDAYYSGRKLVIEYREKQHYQEVPFFDKKDKITVSGVSRNVQRRIYDKRREEILPKHGIDVVVIPYFQLDSRANGKLNRNHDSDKYVITRSLDKYIIRKSY